MILVFLMTYSQNKQELIDVVRRAGACLLELWPGAHGSTAMLAVQEKSDGSLVSVADMRSNEILIEAISRLYPGDAILSEEIPAEPAKLSRASRVWIVDPLDGTSSFVHGRDDFSVLVGLAEGGEATFGAMFFPVRDMLVVGESGGSATCNGRPIHVSKSDQLAPGRVYIRNFTCKRPEVACPMMDSGLALYKVACGELDGAIIRMTTHREWDIAAPQAVLRAAGGRVSSETGEPIKVGTGEIDFEYLIVSNGLVHAELVALI